MSRKNSGSIFARLSSKILLAMGSVLFLFALVLCLYFYIVMMPQGPGDQSSSQSALLAEQINVALLETQKNESLFLLHPDMAPVSKHKAAITQLISLTNRFTQSAQQTADNKSIATASKITASIQKLDSTFLDLVQAQEAKGLKGSAGLLEKIDNAGQQLQEIISRNDAGSLALALLRIQRHEQEYLKSNHNIELQNLETAIKNFSQLLTATRIDPVEAQVLRKGIREYNSAFDRYQAVSLATNDRNLSTTLDKEQQYQEDAMRLAADNLGSVINRINIPDALPMVLVIKQHATAYILTGEEKYAQQVILGLNTLIKAFNSSSILQEHKNQALKTSNMYRDVFASLVQQDTVIKGHVANLNGKAASLETLISSAIKTSPKTTSGKLQPLSFSLNNLEIIAASAGLAVIFIGFLVAIFLGKSISAPIVNMTNTVRRITTEKNFSVEIPVSSKNEIGLLAQELNTLLRLQETSFSQENSVTSGLTDELKVLTDIAHDLRGQIENAGEASSNISGSTTRQNELVDKVNSSITQLSVSANAINQVFSQSDEQNQLIADAVEHIGKSVESTVDGIKAITQSSSQISEIIMLNTEIAEQTNLLALNASVKAARAGSHGKEFAVIADEIAKLAQRSEEIAKEGRQLATSLSTKVDEATKLGDESKKSLDQIHEASRLNLITAEELANQVTDINTNTSELDQLSQSFAAITSEIDSIAKEQGSECATALKSLEDLLNKTSTLGNGIEDEDDNIDASLKQAVDNIAITLNEQEESDESDSDQSDEFTMDITDTEQSESVENNKTGS